MPTGLPSLTSARGYNEALSNLCFSRGTTVDDLYDAIEDSHSVKSLVENINKIKMVKKFNLDRETSSYVRLKNVDMLGNISYLTIKKVEG